ncbi:MAG: peptidase C45 [Betaproteobacteria bacterium]|nr:peptidase C45 [Betaproteobacteria bacterium]
MFPTVAVTGSAFERGRQHGEQASERVGRSIATYARLFAYCGMDWHEAQRRAAPYRDVIGGFDAALLEEIEGIAAGSGRSTDEILALNSRTEILPPSYPGDPAPQWKALAERNLGAGVPDWGECTALAVPRGVSATGGTLLAQNWDWLGQQRAALILLRTTEDDGTAILTLTEAGMLAKIGLNSHGFGVCLNILRSKDDGSRPGVPVHVLLRALLRRRSAAEAIAFADQLSFGASSNVHCADVAGDCAGLECSPRGLYVVRGQGTTLCHTNHYLCIEPQAFENALAASLSSRPRLAHAHALVSGMPRPSLADVERILRDESDGYLSICRRPDPSLAPELRIESVAGIVMELERRVMHVAPDVPSASGFSSVTLEREPALA